MLSTGRLGKTHFTVQKQRDFIAGHGVTVSVTPTLACPCAKAEGLADPLDTHCRGTGRFPQTALTYSTIIMLVTETAKRKYLEAGTWVEGSIIALTPPEITLADQDLVVFQDIRDTFNDEVLQRGTIDRVRFLSGVQIQAVVDFTSTYVPGVDYNLTLPNIITWVAGHGPAVGARYAVKYRAYPEYLCWNDHPRLRVEHHTVQSSETMLRRLDKLTRG